jgi:hypothetical protein
MGGVNFMTLIITTDFDLNKTAAPNLPLAPIEYESRYQEQLNNVLRLYFNRLDALISQLDTANILPPLTNYTVATLPSAVTSGKGARSFVTDALAPTFGATVATGGAIAVPVYSDGTNWKVG